jgi:hypothetical protein
VGASIRPNLLSTKLDRSDRLPQKGGRERRRCPKGSKLAIIDSQAGILAGHFHRERKGSLLPGPGPTTHALLSWSKGPHSQDTPVRERELKPGSFQTDPNKEEADGRIDLLRMPHDKKPEAEVFSFSEGESSWVPIHPTGLHMKLKARASCYLCTP